MVSETKPFEHLGHQTPVDDLVTLMQLAKEIDCKVAVEIGSWVGMSARALVEAGAVVHCIDHFRGNDDDLLADLAQLYGQEYIFRTFCRNMGSLLFKQVFPHVGDSKFWASIWPWQADLVFIDAGHDYQSVKSDIAAWRPHVRKGGILCGHDFKAFPAVERAVRDSLGTVAHEGEVWWQIV